MVNSGYILPENYAPENLKFINVLLSAHAVMPSIAALPRNPPAGLTPTANPTREGGLGPESIFLSGAFGNSGSPDAKRRSTRRRARQSSLVSRACRVNVTTP
jgi:hypothetical protein